MAEEKNGPPSRPRVLIVVKHTEFPQAAVVCLSFKPTPEQLISMEEHLRSWTPP